MYARTSIGRKMVGGKRAGWTGSVHPLKFPAVDLSDDGIRSTAEKEAAYDDGANDTRQIGGERGGHGVTDALDLHRAEIDR